MEMKPLSNLHKIHNSSENSSEPPSEEHSPARSYSNLWKPIPKTINILGHEIKVVVTNKFDKDNCGESHPDKQMILIRKNLSPRLQWLTLLHEACHMCLGLSGHSELLSSDGEEAIVTCLEYGLFPFLQEYFKANRCSGSNLD